MDYNGDIGRALRAAEEEHQKLLIELKEYEEKKLKVSQLESFISLGRMLLGVKEANTTEQEPPSPQSLFQDIDKQPTNLVGKVAEILKDAQKPLSLGELVEEFRKRQWKLSENNPREVLRNSLSKKTDIFNKTLVGIASYYELKKQG